ncbi:outer membrane beta-barrel protein [Pontibacter sp. SGAir0037]|uniref:outer membrane beta-barrel protein n=1 Tax=Pontibacter sp. SGAir0037 TaxID=2571030 RepID=UPI0010CD6881|nr:outer membrane beta-barrel protein [Pontibacter sp. SGAir0037]QCR21087.1 hypothetical protein C1N53_01035 [Pontibacter sp. SGAir0037]
MKHLSAILLFLLLSQLAFSQKDFRKGYIIQGTDTIKGYVDYRGDKRNAQVTIFKPDLNGAEQRLTPTDIAGYGFEKEGKVYESKPIINNDRKEKESIFLNVLIKGKASIYYYRDADAKDRYYVQKDTSIFELENLKYQVVNPGSEARYERAERRYLSTLSSLFSDCPSFSNQQLSNVRFNHSDLIKITNKYNRCINPASVAKAFTNREDQVKITVGPVLSFSKSTLSFTGNSALGRAEFQNDSHLGGGFSFNMLLPSMSEKLSVQTELLYIPAKFSSPSTRYDAFYYEFQFDLAYLKLPVQLRYTYPKGKVQPFVNGGLVLAYAIKDDNKQIVSHESRFREPTQSSAIAAPNFNHFMNGITAGAGLMCQINNKPLALEIRYDKTSDITKNINLSGSIKGFNLLLSYGF